MGLLYRWVFWTILARHIFIAVGLFGLTTFAAAQGWPSKPVRVIVNFPAEIGRAHV